MTFGLRSVLYLLGLSSGSEAPPETPQIPDAVALNLPTSFKQTGINITYSDPLLKEGRVAYLGSLSDSVDSYGHEIRSVGGFYSATMSLKTTDNISTDWIMNGVGRHIEVYNSAQQIIWEGFVDKVSLNIGNFSISVGSLITKEIANRVKIRYSVADYTISPPSVGVTLTSAPANNELSQAKYGVIERTLSANELTVTAANRIRDSWLTEHSFPSIVVSSTTMGNSEPTLTIDCLGYWSYLSTWTYYSSTTGTQTIREKILDILASSPNDLFSTNYTQIEDNTVEVPADERSDRTPDTILTELASYGDASNNRYTIGVYQGRQLFYQPIPTLPYYIQHVGAGISTIDGRATNFWEVLPGRWIFYTGFMDTRDIPVTLETLAADPGSGLIESVSFSTPGDITVTSARFSKLDQLFSRMGMSGI